MKAILLFFINVYRKYISGLKRTPCCRFYPTCSAYTYEAICEWGAIAGLFLGLWRILRCNPLVPGGVDHIPLRGAKKRSVAGYIIFYAVSPYGDTEYSGNVEKGERVRGGRNTGRTAKQMQFPSSLNKK